MKTTLLLTLLTILVVAGAAFIAKRKKTGTISELPTFKAKPALTEPEQVLYFRLVEAVPDCIVLAQVPLSALMTVKGKGRQTWFNKISRKSVDFVVCRKDFSLIAALELDDKSHEAEERKKQDADKDVALNAAGIKLLRLKGVNLPTVEVLRMMIQRIPPAS